MKLKLFVASMLSAGIFAPALAADVTYRNDIRPMVKAKCDECHGSSSPTLAEFQQNEEKYKKAKEGPRTDTYGDLLALVGWPDSGAIMRRLDDGTNTADKKPGNMYKYLGETDAERNANLALFKGWVGEGAWNLKRWNKRGDVPAISKDELEKLKVKY